VLPLILPAKRKWLFFYRCYSVIERTEPLIESFG